MNGVFYGIAIALLALVAFTAVRTQLALFRARSTTAAAARDPLDLYEAAYLAGGPRRVVNTALVSLVSQGGVRVSSEGVVTPVQGFRPRKRTPVERAVHKHVKSAPGGRTTAQVRHSTVDDHTMRRLTTPLWRHGFLMSPADRARARRRTSRLIVFAALAAIMAAVSPFLGGPLGAIMIAAAAVVVGVACFLWLRRAMADPVTKAGRAALARVDVRDLADGSWSSPDDVKLVALHGLTKLPDRQLADTLRRDTRVTTGRSAACCAPGHCGSYGSSYVPVYDGGSYGGGSSEGGFFGGLFDFGGSHGGGYDGGGGGYLSLILT
ncbi:TIGR04222 domain-containing membrane protein [Nonomuraea basaltis]|uniref:TIGR04222 domain-containing membrane protein n=1 Tax=Nonomuraea basaltis TaxID=2495887 RepID=UPI00110C56C0|nr:TIGR04222 domain-containing membrane protein [Nonomuraea basaltis]TMR92001.1 TIGR04222 domain-containing membrane protein [Nonomuraea basaltis]